jgi:SNF family Na+-dependent transporter
MSGSDKPAKAQEAWGSRIGLILAMAGNAVGLGNFLRFPSQAAQNGGGSFMIAYFTAFFLLGIPLMWIEWGVGRHAGRYRKGHVPGMFASLWKHPLAKYLGVLGMIIPLIVLIYYSYIASWTMAFAVFSGLKDYWGYDTQEAMVGYLQSYQAIGDHSVHGIWKPFTFFFITLGITIWVVSRGISAGIEKLAKIGMPILFAFAIFLAVAIFMLPPGADGSTAWDGLNFIFNPDLSLLKSPKTWLAAAGQIFFTLSVGMGTLQAYASYLSKKDDIVLSGIATAATNETAEVVLAGSIAIPAAVVFFGTTGVVAVANSGSFNLGFATMPVVFQQMGALGPLLGVMWFGLLFFAAITSSVAMATPILAFFREEFGVQREKAAWILGGIALAFGLLNIFWFAHGMLDEWDYWAGTFGLVVFATIETILFMWVFKPDNAWKSLHEGADIRIPQIFKFVMTYVTPMYLLILLSWWGIQEAWPTLTLAPLADGTPRYPAESMPYVHASRAIIVAFAVIAAVLVRTAWKRNGYKDREGFVEVEAAPITESLAKEAVR